MARSRSTRSRRCLRTLVDRQTVGGVFGPVRYSNVPLFLDLISGSGCGGRDGRVTVHDSWLLRLYIWSATSFWVSSTSPDSEKMKRGSSKLFGTSKNFKNGWKFAKLEAKPYHHLRGTAETPFFKRRCHWRWGQNTQQCHRGTLSAVWWQRQDRTQGSSC